MSTPDHLVPIEPAEAVHALVDRIGTEIPGWLERLTLEDLKVQ